MAEENKNQQDESVPVKKNDGKLRRDTFHQSLKTSEYQRRHAKRRKEKKKAAKEEKLRKKTQGKDETLKEGKNADSSESGSVKEEKTGKKKHRSGDRAKSTSNNKNKGNGTVTGNTSGTSEKRAGETAVSTAATVPPLILNQIAHRKVAEYEDDNVAVEAIHETEKAAETAVLYSSYSKDKKDTGRKEKKRIGESVAPEHRAFSSDPGESSQSKQRAQNRKMQRRQMQREYAKAMREGQNEAEAGKSAARSVSGLFGELRNKVQEYAAGNKRSLISLGCLILVVVLVINMMSSCGAMFEGMVSTTMSAAYLSRPEDLDAAEVYLTEKEMKLQTKIDRIETDYPGYDEYDYNIAGIGHNPFTLLNYLSAKYTVFTFEEVREEIEDLFSKMYSLTTTAMTETRTRQIPATDESGNPLNDEEGNPVMITEEYQVQILRVKLTAASLEVLVADQMNEEQKEIYEIYQESKGLLQQFASPVDYYWYLYVSSYYGYRKNPHSDAEEFHKGLDISIPSGANVYSGQNGSVDQVGYDSTYGNYVVISDSDGYITKYAFLQSVSVSQGDTVAAGQEIGKSGSSGSALGSQLHIECMFDGVYYNPILYFDVGTETMHGEEATGTGPSSGGFGSGGIIPPDAYDDPAVQRLMEEAVKYIGYPYVWGGSNPSTSFDCSGYVSWVYNASGVHPMERMTAQRIYDNAVVISPSEAKAGDMIVFTGTYKSAGPVSHIGIYCGDGTMLHAGDPIGYANINSSYWQQHFYAFIRWP